MSLPYETLGGFSKILPENELSQIGLLFSVVPLSLIGICVGALCVN